MEKIGQNPKIGQLWRPVAPQRYTSYTEKLTRPRKLPVPWTTTWSKQYLSAVHAMTCSLLWVRCLFDPFSISDFRGKWPLKWKFSKLSFCIRWWDTELHFVAKFGENQPLQSCRKLAWITTQKKLGLCSTRPSPHSTQNGPTAPKIPWMLSPLEVCTYTAFGPDRLRFAGLIPERLIFRPKSQYNISFQRTTICSTVFCILTHRSYVRIRENGRRKELESWVVSSTHQTPRPVLYALLAALCKQHS